MSDPDVEAVAKGLTKAQREAVKREAASSLKIARSMLDLRLYGSFTHWTGHAWYPLSNPTEQGSALRQYLLRQNQGGEGDRDV